MWTIRRSNAGPGLVALAVVSLLLAASPPEVRADADDYWFAFPDQTVSGTSVFSVAITAENGANGNVLWGFASSTPFSLIPGETTTIAMPPGTTLAGSGLHPDGAVRVQTDADVSVTVFTSEDYSGDAFRPLPEGELGTEYVVVSSPAGASGTLPSQFLVVATADGTTVTITASDTNSAGLVPDTATDIDLDLGQVYQVQAPLVGADLTGTLISANQPIAVISGHYLGLVPANTGCCASFMAACLPPVSAWGTDYLVAPTNTRSHDVFRLVAWSNGTTFTATGHPGGTLGQGEFIEFTASQGVYVTSSAPVLLAQYFTSWDVDSVIYADPALLIPPPRTAWGSRYEVQASAVSGVLNYLNVFTMTVDIASVTFDGAPVSAGAWVEMGDMSLAVLAPSAGPHVVEGSATLGVRVYGFKAYWSYGYYCRGVAEEPPPVDPPEDPVLTSLIDVPNDQGRQLRLTWAGSSLDTLASAEPIVEYVLYRRHDPALKTVIGPGSIHDKDANWDYVGAVPAFGEDSYAAVVPTLADSTITDGQYWSFFMVRAATAVPARFFDSEPDSGYSLDNLAPNAPEGLAVAYGGAVALTWEVATDEDFRYFKVYRGDEPDFTVDPQQPVHTTTGTDWIDPVGDFQSYYKLAAVDFAGNESLAAMPQSVSGAGGAVVPRLQLAQNTPNPFNPMTMIAFELPAKNAVWLRVYDVSGGLVSTLVGGEIRTSGRHEILWDGKDLSGGRVASGTYFYRLEAGDHVQTKRMTLLK